MSDQISKLKSKLGFLELASLAEVHHFHLRNSGKFSSLDFVLGFFLSFLSGGNSLRHWAEKISQCSGVLLSKQGLSARMDARLVNFSKGVFSRALAKPLFAQSESLYAGDLFAHFRSVLIEDSSCLKLPAVLAPFFPGAHSKRLKGPAATARIQLRYSLKAEQYTHLAIQSFRQNDQSYAYQIVSSIQAGDLVLRDLGYFVLGSFTAILKAKGHLLSRYRFGVNLFDPGDGRPFCLNQRLAKMEKAKQTIWEQWVKVGEQEQVPLRIIAIRLPESVVAERIRKAKKNRHQRAHHSKAYFELLKWNIFLTSVDSSIWSAKQAARAYTLRWRIEMIFKTWKSHLDLAKMFAHKQSLRYERVMIQLYLSLSWMLLFLMPWYRFFSQKAVKNNPLNLSIAKFTQWAKEHFKALVLTTRLDSFWKIVQYYCLEEPRRKRISQLQIMREKFPLA